MKKLHTLLLSSFILGLSSFVMGQATNPQDSLGLVAIYNTSNGPNWNASWDLNSPVSSWSGIDINGNGQVTVISLPENNIQGTFGGFDPQTQLTALQTLNLGDNFITSITALPPSLQVIDISTNKLSYQDVLPIRDSFANSRLLDSPQISFGPDIQASGIVGDSLRIVAEADNTPGNDYQWIRGGQIIQRGPSNVLVIPALTPADSGAYQVRLLNSTATANNFIYQNDVNVIVTVDPPYLSHESARDPSNGRLRAVLRIPPGIRGRRPGLADTLFSTLKKRGITKVEGESCLCEEFSLYHFPESSVDDNGDILIGAIAQLNSACAKVESIGGNEIQLGYDYKVKDPNLLATGPELNIRLDGSLDMTNLKPVRVAVIDLGIDSTHTQLRPFLTDDEDQESCLTNDAMGYNFYADNNNPFDVESSHGTHVAGIITDFIPNLPVELLSVQVGKKGDDTRLFDLICGIRYAALQKVDLINMSMGYSGPYSMLLKSVIKDLATSPMKTQMIAGSGNDTTDLRDISFWPASFSDTFPTSVIAVTAMDSAYTQLADFSNFGDSTVRIAAPGSQILSTLNGNTYGYMSGTSMATPFVTALMAYIKARDKFLNNPSTNPPITIALDKFFNTPDFSVVEPNLAGMVNRNKKLKVLMEACINTPFARDDKFLANTGSALTFEVRNNDCPSIALTPQFTGTSLDPAKGAVSINGDGTMTFTPASGFEGDATFQYQLCSAGSVCSIATVTLMGPDTKIDILDWWWVILILIILFYLAYLALRRTS